MTEAEWLTGTDPEQVLRYLAGTFDEQRKAWIPGSFRASDRKFRLFAWGCFRTCHAHYPELPGLCLVTATEYLVDEVITAGEWSAAARNYLQYLEAHPNVAVNHVSGSGSQTEFSDRMTRSSMRMAAMMCAESDGNIGDAYWILVALRDVRLAATNYSTEPDLSVECALLRDVIGNPFRPVTVAPESLSRDIVALATSIYENRFFDRMPALADALEAAGCTNADILAHCRGPGPHVRGCWAVDLILGKE